jgi:hypothetical protein
MHGEKIKNILGNIRLFLRVAYDRLITEEITQHQI